MPALNMNFQPKYITMKKLLSLLFAAFISTSFLAQTGAGIVLQTEPFYTFTPTTVGDETTFNFQLINTVAIEQSVLFGGLDAPFALADDAPQIVSAADTLDLSITFSPTSIDAFSDTLNLVGTIFGNAMLVVSGDGIQVVLEWSVENVSFATTPLGQTSIDESLVFSSVGDGTGILEVTSISTPEFSVEFIDPENGSEFIPGSIPEDEQRVVRLYFSPSIAGNTSGQITFASNDPNSPEIIISVNGDGLSEVSGEFCDATWSLINSPFTLLGDVTVPEGCSLTIEPGVEVNMGGHNLNVDGNLICAGSASLPIKAYGGNLILNDGESTTLEYFHIEDLDNVGNNSPYELVYYNNFELSDQQYDFDCFDYDANYYATGTSESYSSYGCDNFNRTSNSSYSLQSNEGDYCLYFYSNTGGDGYLYLADTPIAPSNGTYEFSFTYESDRYENDCFMTIDVLDENGNWVTLYTSPTDIESNSELTRFARGVYQFNAGEEMRYRIKHHNGVNDTYTNQLYTYIDEVRIEKLRDMSNVVEWNFDNNESEFQSLISSHGEYGGEPRVSLNEGVLRLNSHESSISFNTESWSNAPIIVPEDGWYYIEVENRLISASYNTYNYWEYHSSDNGSWHKIIDNQTLYSQSQGPETYDWRKDVIHSYEYLSAGSRIDFYYNSSYWTTAGQIEWEGQSFKIYQLDETSNSTLINQSQAKIVSNRETSLFNVLSPRFLAGNTGTPISITQSSISDITVECDSAIAVVDNFNGTSLMFDGVNNDVSLNDSQIETFEASGLGSIDITNSLINHTVFGNNSLGSDIASDLIYYNNFESSDQRYDFDCFDYNANYYATGTSENYDNYGCYEFYRTSSSSYSLQSNEGDYCLYFYSDNGGDGYLYMADTPIAPSNGTYEFSFTYESDRYENDCFMTIDVLDENGNWVTLYSSPTDIESNSTLTRFARGVYQFNAGEEMRYRIKHHNGVNSSYTNQLYTYIDEVRIEKLRDMSNVVEWNFDNNESEFQSLISSYGEYGGEPRVSLNEGVLRLNSHESNISFNTDSWSNAPIIVPEDGWYYIEIENKLNSASYNTYNYWEYHSSDNGSWHKIIDNQTLYSQSLGPETYDWRKDVIHSYEYLTAGSRIDFKYDSYYWTTAGKIDWEGQSFKIYQLVQGGSNNPSDELSIVIEESTLSSLEVYQTSSVVIANSTIENSESSGITIDASSANIELSHTYVRGHQEDGININVESGALILNNTVVVENGDNGLETNGSDVNLHYVTIANNSGNGLTAASNGPSGIYNSIFSNNTSGTWSGGNYLLEYNYSESYPQFQEDSYQLELYSPAVDAGMPWHTDQHMPYGIGGLRADQGAYGGPNNAGWGGTLAPDGAPEISSVSDSPQDQGSVVGLSFDASAFDNTLIPQNVTHYAFWRHYDPTGTSISTLDEGSWELLGDMPAQSFNGYAYQASTLGNTNIFGNFNSCFTVVAHTDDDDTYWYSNVLCGESQDNLAPEVPELEGMVLETGDIQIMWTSPFEEDYAYTEVTSDAGFTAEVTGDTLSVDASVELGVTYTYTAIHFDVNGNASDPSSLTLETAVGSDEIVLHAGWNLISTDRIPTDANVSEVFAGLSSGNLQYVTGFNYGIQFYDPSGLAFLNTLENLNNGYGYWVKVFADDVLNVTGASISSGYLPPLNEGWNLVGHMSETATAPEVVFEDLYDNGDLLYVTGFDQGVQVYDPNGLPFLNTLTEMRNGFGYWVKSAVATDGGVLAPTVGDEVTSIANPRYAVLNGTSNLEAFAGEFVHVINARGNTVSRLEILPGGYLMTTALYEDENGMYGLRPGDALRFSFHGSVVEIEGNAFKGEMEHVKLNLEFTELEATLAVFPNPMTSTSNISYTLLEKGEVLVELLDIQGRVLEILDQGARKEGLQIIEFNASDLAAGTYAIRLTVEGVEVSSKKVVKTSR